MNYNDERVGKFLNENRVIRVDEVAKCKNLIEKYLEWEQQQVENLNIDDVSPVNIEIKDWDYTCGDGCCYEYGETISVNGKECDNHHAGGSVKQSLEYTLTELKIPFNINEG